MTVSLELDMMDLIDLSNPPKYVHQDFHLPVKSALQYRSIQNISYLQELTAFIVDIFLEKTFYRASWSFPTVGSWGNRL